MKQKPKLVITDIDGVWTDGGMYYDQTGNEWKKFNTSDSAGVLFLKFIDIPIAIVTGENTEIVKRRAKKLSVENIFLGVKNKKKVVEELCREKNISLNEVAFVGDDINDIELLEAVGLSATPQNAPDYIKEKVHLQLKTKGGEGAFREFAEYIVKQWSSIDFVLEKYKNQ